MPSPVVLALVAAAVGAALLAFVMWSDRG